MKERRGEMITELFVVGQILRGFNSWAVSHVRRAGNMVAHNLAKLAVLHPQNHVWFGNLPACILSLVSFEC
jgi:hypothetical protein